MYLATVLEQPLALEPVTPDDFIPAASNPAADAYPDDDLRLVTPGEPSAVHARHR